VGNIVHRQDANTFEHAEVHAWRPPNIGPTYVWSLQSDHGNCSFVIDPR
jgi:hypothetical protein